MKLLPFILATAYSITISAAEEQPEPESTEQPIFRKKRNSFRLNTGRFPLNPQDEDPDTARYSKTYFNYKQNDDGSITISTHSKNYNYATSSYKHKVTLSVRDLVHLEALHSCYLHPEGDPRCCTLIAGTTVANMYNEIKVLIPLFFEYLEQLRNQQTKS